MKNIERNKKLFCIFSDFIIENVVSLLIFDIHLSKKYYYVTSLNCVF